MKIKQIMLMLMSVLLLLTVIVASLVLDRVSGLFQLLNNPNEPSGATDGTSQSSQAPDAGPTDASTPPPVTEVPHVHEMKKSQTVSPTCTNWGYTLYSCSCGKTDTQDFKDPLGHNYGSEIVVPVTCEQDGYTERTCSRCKDVDKQNLTEALGHDYQFVKTQVGTCVDDGYDEYTCTHCKDIKKENLQVAPGHTFGDWSVTEPAGDTTPGKKERACSACGKTEIQGILPLNQGTITHSVRSDEEWTSYEICIFWTDNPKADIYYVYIGLNDRGIGYKYANEGLTITYTVNGVDMQYTFPLDEDAPVLTVKNDGTVSVYAPGEEPDAPLDPTPSEPDASEPDASEPDASEPNASEPDASEPDASEPNASEPDASEPNASEPDASEPDASEPDTPEPDSSEPQ